MSAAGEMPPITIIKGKDGLEVTQNGRTTGPLCFGELLEQISALTAPHRNPSRAYCMRTPEQWNEYRKRLMGTSVQANEKGGE